MTEEKKPLKIAIVGTAPSSRTDAPYKDESWQIWSLGSNQTWIPRFNRWFELHTFDALAQADALQKERVDFFRKIGKDLYIGHENPILPNATMYPKDEVVGLLGRYFTSSIAWMIGLAILEGADEIGLWGVDMIGECEYAYQRACCEYLLGIARGKGITITVTPKSPLLRAERMYAFEYTELAGETQAKIAEARRKQSESDDEYLTAIEKRGYWRGFLTCLHDYERRYG